MKTKGTIGEHDLEVSGPDTGMSERSSGTSPLWPYSCHPPFEPGKFEFTVTLILNENS